MRLSTARLELFPLDVRALDAWVAGDLQLLRELTGVVVGAGGCGAGPDAQGVVVFGYSIYPEHQRRGFATEASRALVGWYFSDPRVRLVRATVPPDHTPSVRVVEKCGL